MIELKETGGAKIGRASATWPFAKLIVTDKTLTINASILGKLVFTRSDIQSIQVYSKYGFLRKGIQLNHSVPGYNETVVFWTTRDPQQLIHEITQTGFFENNARLNPIEEMELKEDRRNGSFPLKIPFAIAIIILWNLLSFIDLKKSLQQETLQFGFGKGFVFSTGMLMITCLLLLFVQPFQRLALKEGKQPEDIRIFVYFLLIIAFVLFWGQFFLP